MASVRRAWMPGILLLATLGLAGCPPAPKLAVTPLAVVIPADKDATEIQITNVGGGTLNWTVSENLPWLQLQRVQEGPEKQAANQVTGSLVSGTDAVELVIDRRELSRGTVSGDVQVITNGGNQTVRVSAITGGAAQLIVSNASIDIGYADTSNALSLRNDGDEPLNWSLTISENAPWLSAVPDSGTLTTGHELEAITLTVDRGTIAAGPHLGTIHIASNGGEYDIPVSMLVAPFEVQPSVVTFGTVFTTAGQNISIKNNAFGVANIAISSTSDANWLNLSPNTPTLAVPSRGSINVDLSADATGLPPGDYTGDIALSMGDYILNVPVSMSVTAFLISDTLLEFGAVTETTSQGVTFTNAGNTPITWTRNIPTNATWLSATPSNGTLGAAPQTLQISVDPSLVDPGSYTSTITVNHNGVSDLITVTFTRPRPAGLSVSPSDINFGTAKSTELVGIWNPGIGTVNWQIDTSAFPAWLALTPLSGSNLASGSVTGTETDSVIVNVNRAAAPLGETEFEHSFIVTGNTGSEDIIVPMHVSMKIPLIPRIVVEPEGRDANNIDFINFAVEENTQTFKIRNEGNGLLTWQFDQTNKPDWLASIQPSQGNLDPNTEVTVTVTVDRSSLTYLGAQQLFAILTNDPDREEYPLLVEVQVPKRVAIGTRPDTVAFGTTSTADIIQVANTGDPDTLLNFQITSSKEWLSVFPETGSSIGTASNEKDFRNFTVTIDRSLLDSSAASGLLTISAYETENGIRVPLADVPPAIIQISVQAAPLTIETTPLPYLRPPSIVRAPMILRNIRYQPITLAEADLDSLAQRFLMLENDTPIELTETAQRIKGGFSARPALTSTAFILLDYSGSMYEAAASVDDPDIAEAPDPLQALYERCIPQLLDSLPQGIAIGLGVISERGPRPLTAVYGTLAEPVDQQDELYITDHEALKNRLRGIVVVDHGATELFDAIYAALPTMRTYDADRDRYLADTAEFPAIICVTDGRVTTPPQPVSGLVADLQLSRIRFYPVGWGKNVTAGPLVALATGTGGHYYSTHNQPTGEVDAFGTPIRKPVASELENWCANDADPCDQSIAKDFNSLVTLSYVSLNQLPSVSVQGRVTFDDPTDQDSDCIPEQGDITGSFLELASDMSIFAADNRMGQISMRSNGIDATSNTARVVVRLETAPRNLSQLSFRLTADAPATLNPDDILKITEPNDGVISDWTKTVAGDTVTFTAPGPSLEYGEFGDLFSVVLRNATAPIALHIEVLSPEYEENNLDSKYFCLPDAIQLQDNRLQFASALPTPLVTTSPPFDYGYTRLVTPPDPDPNAPFSDVNARVLDLGTSINEFTFNIQNVGGHYLFPGSGSDSNVPFLDDVLLTWSIDRTGTFGTAIFPRDTEELAGYLSETSEVDTLHFSVDRTLDPGVYEGNIVLNYGMNGMRIGSFMPTLVVRWTVGTPVLTVNTNTLDFGTTDNTLPISITNTGLGSTLSWRVRITADNPLPDWLSLNQTLGTLNTAQSISPNVTVDRSGRASGTYSFTMRIEDENNLAIFQDILVAMQVP